MKRKLLHVSMALAMVTFGVKSYSQANSTELESQATVNGEAILSELHKNVFIENKGQWSSQALAKIDLPFQSAWITADGWRMNFYSLEKNKQADVNSNHRAKPSFKEHAIHFTHLNANSSPQLVKQKAVNPDVHVNYFSMDNFTMYQDVKAFEEVVMKDVYNGIDQRWYLDNNGKLRFDYIVQPNANPQQIKIKVDGAERVYIENNEVKIVTSVGLVTMGGLKTMQENRVIKSRWSVTNNNELAFAFENYNPNLPLIIDPYISINAFIDDPSYNGFFTTDMASTPSHVYLVGYTISPSFPTTPGAAYTTGDGSFSGDGIIARFNGSLTNLVNATYITGSIYDDVVGIEVGNNDIIIAGNTWSSFVNGGDDFGLMIPQVGPLGFIDIYLMKLSLNLSSVTQSRIIGGSSIENVRNLYNGVIVGRTYSSDFPIVGGTGTYQNSSDGVIIKFNATTLNVTYSDIYGGNDDDELIEYVADGNFELLIGNTMSGSFTSHPSITANNSHNSPGNNVDGFIITLDASPTIDFLGGSGHDFITTVAYGDVINIGGGNQASSLFIGGYTYSNDFTQITGGFQTTNNSSWDYDGFILQYKVQGNFTAPNVSLSNQVGTYWGDMFSQDEIKVLKLQGSNLFVAGKTVSTNLPHLSNSTYMPSSFNKGFISKFNWQGTANISNTGIKNPPVYASLHSNIPENIHVINSNRVILGGNSEAFSSPLYDSIAYPTPFVSYTNHKMIATDFCLGYVYNNNTSVIGCPGYIIEIPISNSQLFTSITWKDPSNNTLSTNDTLILDPYDGSPFYMLHLTDIVGCTSKIKFTVNTFNPNPPLNAYALDSTLCPGQVLSLKTSNSVFNAKWYLPDGSVVTNLNPIITVYSQHAGNVVAKLYNNTNTCVKFDTVPVYVTPIPAFSSNYEEACEGEDIMLSVTTPGMVSYNWTAPNGATHVGASWSLNNVTSAQHGIYNVIVTDGEGCTNSGQMQVVVNPMPITTVVPNGSQLIAVQSGATYQWVNCSTNQPIPAPQGVQQTLIPDSINHQYKVIINLNGCIDSSACFVNMTGIDEEMLQTYGWIVYPNPNNGSFTVHLVENASFDLVDMNGKVIRSFNNLTTGANNITENLPTGVYMLVNKSNYSVARIIIE